MAASIRKFVTAVLLGAPLCCAASAPPKIDKQLPIDFSAQPIDIDYKNHSRKGYIGLQDHGQNCWYKNIKLLPLN